MAIPYNKGNDILFDKMMEDFSLLGKMAEADNDTDLVKAVDTVIVAMHGLQDALVTSSKRAETKADEIIQKGTENDPWAKLLLSHRR